MWNARLSRNSFSDVHACFPSESTYARWGSELDRGTIRRDVPSRICRVSVMLICEEVERTRKNIYPLAKHESRWSPSGAFTYFHVPRVRTMRIYNARYSWCVERFRLLCVRQVQMCVSGMLHERVHSSWLGQWVVTYTFASHEEEA